MDKKIYQALKNVARNSFMDWQFGLKAYLEANQDENKKFTNRMFKFKFSQEFAMQPNEEIFHMIGFLDGIAWLARNDYIDFKKAEEESEMELELEANSTKQERELMNGIITDAQILEQFNF